MTDPDKEAQAHVEGIVIHESCGCVFCDLDFIPQNVDGRLVHVMSNIPPVACTRSSREAFGHRNPEEEAAAFQAADSGPIGFNWNDLPSDTEPR